MKVNEIKETVERVIRTEYVAEDGQTFCCEEECRKYEESALFAISKQLKRMTRKEISQYDINDDCSDEYLVEIFDIQTEKDLENLNRYARLKSNSRYNSNSDLSLNNVTIGHEVIVFWNYDQDYCWAIGNGSIDAYCDYIRGNITRLIAPEIKEEK